MGGQRRNYDVHTGFTLQDYVTDLGYDSVEGQQLVMAMGLGGCGTIGDRDLAHEGVHTELAGNNFGV